MIAMFSNDDENIRDAGKKVKIYSISLYPFWRAMASPLSTEYPTAGELRNVDVIISPI